MPIPQRGIALASPCAHGGRIVRLEPGQLSGQHRAKAVLTTPRNPPFGPAHEAQGRVCSPREIFFSHCGSAAMAGPSPPLQLIAT